MGDAASYARMAVLGAHASNRVYPVPLEWRRLVHLGVIVATAFTADRWLSARGLPLSGIGLSAEIGLLVAVPALLVLTGFFRRGEWKALRSLVSPAGS